MVSNYQIVSCCWWCAVSWVLVWQCGCTAQYHMTANTGKCCREGNTLSSGILTLYPRHCHLQHIVCTVIIQCHGWPGAAGNAVNWLKYLLNQTLYVIPLMLWYSIFWLATPQLSNPVSHCFLFPPYKLTKQNSVSIGRKILREFRNFSTNCLVVYFTPKNRISENELVEISSTSKPN